jgi:hypothetical protein
VREESFVVRHWSLVICHWSFVVGQPTLCDIDL